MQNEPRRESSPAWRMEPTSADKARAGLPPPKSAFSIFLAPSSANSAEVARLLAEISNLQSMLGGQGIEYRLAGVRCQALQESGQ
jgi:hypothetical protein